jgi:hypothetical protein
MGSPPPRIARLTRRCPLDLSLGCPQVIVSMRRAHRRGSPLFARIGLPPPKLVSTTTSSSPVNVRAHAARAARDPPSHRRGIPLGQT